MGSLAKSSEQGCRICSRIHSDNVVVETRPDSITYKLTNIASDRVHIGFTCHASSKSLALPSQIYALDQMPNFPYFGETSLEVSDIETLSTGSDRSLLLASTWLSECVKNHEECNKSRFSNWYPSRLLDIGVAHDDQAFLISKEKSHLEGSYIALSYCWGSVPMKLTLNAASIDLLTRGIPVKDLPRLYQDVIGVVQKLRVRYLWIDSLCILQDSREDWEKEAAQMANVYGNSYCTIAATQAASSVESLFSERLPESWIIDSSGVSGKNKKCSVIQSSFWIQGLEGRQWAPLGGRAWVVQERFLPSRVLHFGRHQLSFECRRGICCESFPIGVPSGFESPECKSKFEKSTPLSCWKATVIQYSACRLTVADDRLVAIAGIARALKSSIGGDYLAGIWVDQAASLLLWRKNDDGRREKIRDVNGDSVPSWSWLSHGAGVSYGEKYKENKDLAPCINVQTYSSFEDPDDNLMRIKDISMCIQGVLLPIRLSQNTDLWNSKEYFLPFQLDFSEDYYLHFEPLFTNSATRTGDLWCRTIAKASFDTNFAIEDRWDGVFLPLGTRDIRSGTSIRGLVVTPVFHEGRSCYRRLGYLETFLELSAQDAKNSRLKTHCIRTINTWLPESPKALDIRSLLGWDDSEKVDLELI